MGRRCSPIKSVASSFRRPYRSAGLWEYGDIRPYVLPHSGVMWWLATTRVLAEPPMETGVISVDAYLPDAAAPIEQILPLLTEERVSSTSQAHAQ